MVRIFIGSALSFIALADLPMSYYTFLRIYLTIVAGIMAFRKYSKSESINIWVILFGITAILFNPIIPVYLHDESIWAIINIAVGLLFAISAFHLNENRINN
jgi:hypothetical protein